MMLENSNKLFKPLTKEMPDLMLLHLISVMSLLRMKMRKTKMKTSNKPKLKNSRTRLKVS